MDDSGTSPAGDREGGVSEIASDALRYWEPRRLVFNGAMALVAVATYIHQLVEVEASPGFPPFQFWIWIFILAIIANILYSVVYPVELFVQRSEFRNLWRRWRWILLALGTVFAMCLTMISMWGLVLIGQPDFD